MWRPETDFFYRHRAKFSEPWLAGGVICIILLVVVSILCLHAFGLLGTTITLPDLAAAAAEKRLDCTADIGYIPVLITSCIGLLVIVPILAHLAYGPHSPHHLMVEIIMILFVTLLSIALYVLMQIGFGPLVGRIPAFSPEISLLIGIVIAHAFIIIQPSYNVIRNKHIAAALLGMDKTIESGYTRAAFDRILRTSDKLRDFKRFTVRDYSVEYVVFYEVLRELLHPRCLAHHRYGYVLGVSRPFDIWLNIPNRPHGFQGSVYWMIMVFIADGAPLKVKLKKETTKKLMEALEEGAVDTSTLTMMRDEIITYMYETIYPRFLQRPEETYRFYQGLDKKLSGVSCKQERNERMRREHEQLSFAASAATIAWIKDQANYIRDGPHEMPPLDSIPGSQDQDTEPTGPALDTTNLLNDELDIPSSPTPLTHEALEQLKRETMQKPKVYM
jgi:hypothetical protein